MDKYYAMGDYLEDFYFNRNAEDSIMPKVLHTQTWVIMQMFFLNFVFSPFSANSAFLMIPVENSALFKLANHPPPVIMIQMPFSRH